MWLAFLQFFFQTNELGFHAEFLGVVKLISAIASLGGEWHITGLSAPVATCHQALDGFRVEHQSVGISAGISWHRVASFGDTFGSKHSPFDPLHFVCKMTEHPLPVSPSSSFATNYPCLTHPAANTQPGVAFTFFLFVSFLDFSEVPLRSPFTLYPA